MNIVILLVGSGSPFMWVPRPLVPILGKPFLFHLLDRLQPKREDRLLVVYDSDLDRFDFRARMAAQYPSVGAVLLESPATGTADAALRGLRLLGDGSKVLVLNGETLYPPSVIENSRSASANVLFYPEDGQASSHAMGSVDARATEMKRVAPFADTGASLFLDGSVLTRYCEWELARRSDVTRVGISAVIARMLDDGHHFMALEESDFHRLGTPVQVREYCVEHARLSTVNLRFGFAIEAALLGRSDSEEMANIANICRVLDDLGHDIIFHIVSEPDATGRSSTSHRATAVVILEGLGVVFDQVTSEKPDVDVYVDEATVARGRLEEDLGFYAADSTAKRR